MADSSIVDSFIAAQNFCTGSQTDYSTCIANNMRFTPFKDDTYDTLAFGGLSNINQDLPLIYGDTYVDLVPLAIANIFTRILMTNSYGGVSFRCSDVFNRPRLPLPRLQDLGIPSQDIINIIGIDPSEPEAPGVTFEGIPISPDDSLLGWMFNYINLLIGYTTSVSTTMTKGREIKGIILGMLDYYKLPELSNNMADEAARSLLLYNECLRYLNMAKSDAAASNLLIQNIDIIIGYMSIAEGHMVSVRSSIDEDIVDPLSIINENTDFTVFDFTITDGVATAITAQEHDHYPFIFSFSMQAKSDTSVYGIPPLYPKDDEVVSKRIVDNYSSVLRNTMADSLALIARTYSASNLMEELLYKIDSNEIFYNNLSSNQAYYIATTKANITDPLYIDVIDQLEVLLSTFNFGTLTADIRAVHDPEDYETKKLVSAIVDSYYDSIGNVSNIELYNLISTQQALYNTDDTGITTVYLGGDYKDSGKFYYADIAYAVGYAKLEQIKSIQINEEYYELTPTAPISESGCAKYTFSRHVLPTYIVEVDMYIYPGTPDQAYCPTVNKYHNFLTSKYSGMFTKMDEGEMGLFVFKGYKPMEATVEEVIKIGTADLNSINLNDPSLDQKAYETMVMKEVKNLTNSSSINGEPISTEDFKYYLAATLIDESQVSNYPGLAIIEFKNMPLGTSMGFPKITVNVEGGDLL